MSESPKPGIAGEGPTLEFLDEERSMIEDRVAVHRETARRKYDAMRVGHEIGYVKAWYTPDGEIHEPFNVTMFAPTSGEHTVAVDSIDPNSEFQMFWKRIPDFGIKEYEVFPHEAGWVAKQVYRGTALDGSEVVAYQAEFVWTDDQCRVVRVERYKDMSEWHRVWAVATGRSVSDVEASFTHPDGAQQLMEDVTAPEDGAPIG
jgi:hypothetical protein